MRVLAHRGLWKEPAERNTLGAFRAAFQAGHGVELDVRDLAGEIVISHDPPRGAETAFSEVIALRDEIDPTLTLAVNVKADGLHEDIAELLGGRTAWFAFDTSVPEGRRWTQAGLPWFSRLSDIEPTPPLLDAAAGVWVDSFDADRTSESDLLPLLDMGKQLALVSPELHGRDPSTSIKAWRTWSIRNHPDVFICTDRPELLQDLSR